MTSSRMLVDRAVRVASVGGGAVVLLVFLLILLPLLVAGSGAFVFRGTIEHRRMLLEVFERGDANRIGEEEALVRAARMPIFSAMRRFESDLNSSEALAFRLGEEFVAFKDALRRLVGPLPGEPAGVLLRDRYGAVRWSETEAALADVLYAEAWVYPSPDRSGKKQRLSRAVRFAGTPLYPVFDYLRDNLAEIMRPRWTVYWGFLFDPSRDAHHFGGIWAELLGTLVLAFGAVIVSAPVGVLAAIQMNSLAPHAWLSRLARGSVELLAGVPSIVLGLFGLVLFVDTLRLTPGKSVWVGALTLAVLVLPTIVRVSQDALRRVPAAQRMAASSLGARPRQVLFRLVLPAALPGILAAVVSALARAAGATAPIIFTAAVSVGRPVERFGSLSEPTPALTWGVYNVALRHEAQDPRVALQYGMVLTLVLVVALLYGAARLLRHWSAVRMQAPFDEGTEQ